MTDPETRLAEAPDMAVMDRYVTACQAAGLDTDETIRLWDSLAADLALAAAVREHRQAIMEGLFYGAASSEAVAAIEEALR